MQPQLRDHTDQKQPEKLSAKRELWHSITAHKPALIGVIIALVLDGVFAAFIPLTQKMLLENQSVTELTLYTTICALQVLSMIVFFTKGATLSAYMFRYLMMKVAEQVESTSEEHLAWIRGRHSQVHSSLVDRLVTSFGTNLPSAAKNFAIVLGQWIGLGIAFGWKYMISSAVGLVLLYLLVSITLKEKKRLSTAQKPRDAKANNHADTLSERLGVWQGTGTTKLKRQNLWQVLTERITLVRHSERPMIAKTGLTRTLPTFISMWLTLYLAISEQHTAPELAMIYGYVHTTMAVSYMGLQVWMDLADRKGDLDHLDEMLNSPPRPEGKEEIKGIKALSISADLRVELREDPEDPQPARVLFQNGLFPFDKERTELCIKAGEFFVLVGPSGCGKTRFVEILARRSENMPKSTVRWTADYYRISTGGRKVPVPMFDTSLSSFSQHFFYCSQHANWVDGVCEIVGENWKPGTVRENIGLHLHNQYRQLCLSADEQKELIHRAAAAVGLLDHLDQPVHTLSGGEKVRCMLARELVGAMLSERPVLIMDETLSQLDEPTGKWVIRNVRRLIPQAIVGLITHIVRLTPDDAKVLVFGEAGEGIIQFGIAAELAQQPDSAYSAYLRGELG